MTVPGPVPAAPPVIVTNEPAGAVADHAQPAGAVTVTVFVPPAGSTRAEEEESV